MGILKSIFSVDPTKQEEDEPCDHEWGDEEIEILHRSEIFHNAKGYYIYENEVSRKECEKCGDVDSDLVAENRVYLSIRERVPQ